MQNSDWKPSKRAKELLGVLWGAYENQDKWVRFENPATARMTGVSLVWNGLGEFDESPEFSRFANGIDYSMRIRLSESYLNANGFTHTDDGWKVYVAEIAAMEAEDAAEAAA